MYIATQAVCNVCACAVVRLYCHSLKNIDVDVHMDAKHGLMVDVYLMHAK